MDDTLQVQPDPNKEWRPSGLDLSVTSPGQPTVRWPLFQQRTRVGSASDNDLVLTGLSERHAVIHFEGEKLYVTSLDTAAPVVLNGQPVGLAELKAGDVLTLEDHSLEVAGLAAPAFLEAYGEPLGGQVWTVGPQDTTIGRPGRRANRVELPHPTISRSHATVVVRGEQFHLLAESEQSLCQVNGHPLAHGERWPLADGDLVGLGKLLFRFRLAGTAAPPGASDQRLRIFSLGPLQVFRGQEAVPETTFRSQAARYVLAYLAMEWDKPVSVETLLELFWPDLATDKGRRNLNWTLSTLRQTLRGEKGGEGTFVLRTHQSVQIDPDNLGSHDLVDLRQALTEGPARLREGDPTPLRLALELYRGPYLEGCYMDWALNRRTQLEQDLLAAGLELLAADLAQERPAPALATARRLLTLDSCCQEAYLAGMQACRALGRPEEGLRLFETCQATLRRELGIEPSVELMREKLLCA